MLVTAAHCVSGNGVGMVFAPGYRHGSSPYGRWTVTAVHLAPGWMKSQNPQDDFALLTVAPATVHGRRTEIEQVTGAYALGGNPRAGQSDHRAWIPDWPQQCDHLPHHGVLHGPIPVL
ncbi:MAG: hypothetical protein QOF83_3138 [Solirubrobacteraceae bacterium]|jgi:hypothetical protein|nr:hypothetical protein [Solirubrobacteraceae bacterium]